jgi:DNA excision repair protein ERCC-2
MTGEVCVAVRDLVQFCYRRGDIDHRFTPSPSGSQGIEGHQRLYRRRPDSYQPEYALQHRAVLGDQTLLLRGRADGVDLSRQRLEEIKTCRIPFDQIPQAVQQMHWAQASVYGAMLAQEQQWDQVELQLCWFNIDTGEEFSQSRVLQLPQLQEFLLASLQQFSQWLSTLLALRRERNESLVELGFPHGEFRPGQREIAELVYKCVDQGGQLMVEAPTGIGKTSAVLYPALKALEKDKHDAVIYATARVVGRRAAEQTLELFRQQGLKLVALSLSSKDSICLSPGKACQAEDCPYADGYYDRLPQALSRAAQGAALRREELLQLAEEFTVCPYQLAMDLIPWVDMVIADVHYVYSLSAGLSGQMLQDDRRWSVLLDEAHNLPARARDMYRAELAKQDLMQVRQQAPAPLKRHLNKLNKLMLALQNDHWQEADYDCREEIPAELELGLLQFVSAIGEAQAADWQLLQQHASLREFFFSVLQFQRVAEQWGDDYRFERHRGEGKQGLKLVLNCLDGARLLREKNRRQHSLTAFSATLSPAHWSRASLGLEEQTVCSRQDSPFARHQLQVYLGTHVDTRYQQRQASLPQLAAALQQWLAQHPGNCLIYFPSYQYLRDAVTVLNGTTQPGEPSRTRWVQRPGTSRDEQYQLLELLRDQRDVAAFCILGGVFGEGIDLPGDQLASVVVVGVGLPQFNRDTRRLKDWHEARGDDGFAFTYLYPGMQKVDQALGRVVRTAQDCGQALLLDSRYAWPEYRNLLPPWWTYHSWLVD